MADAAAENAEDNNTSHRIVSVQRKFNFPKSVIAIVFVEICQRFSFSGMKCFLAIYLLSKLNFSENLATKVYHSFCTVAYFLSIFGAVLADGFLGKFRTILYMVFGYFLGLVILSASAIPINQTWLNPTFGTILGLLLIAVGTGSIKPCVASFSGDQFHLPDQSKQVASFFVYYYLATSVSSMAAKLISPALKNIQCFGDKECYSLGFGAPVILIIISGGVFFAAQRYYVIKNPSGNIIIKIFKCITYSIGKKIRGPTINSHWLDSSTHLYGEEFIADLKTALGIVKTLLPLSFYYALLDQQGSRWTLQAAKMDLRIGNIELSPDQVSVVVPITTIITLTIFEKLVYPFLENRNIRISSCYRLMAGFLLAAVAFLIAGTVELSIQNARLMVGTEPNLLSVVWLLPQMFFISIGDVFFSTTSQEFAFNQAPASMKALMQAALMTMQAFGNIIIIIGTRLATNFEQSTQSFAYASMALVAMVAFYFLSKRFDMRLRESQDRQLENTPTYYSTHL